MNNIIIKNNETFGDIRFINIEGKPYAVANDVAKALGYVRPNDAISSHCKSTVKHRIPHPQSKTKQIEVNVIPEGDIYRLIIKSKLSTAQKFEEWVMEEVLPSIRKSGMYAVDELLDNPDLLIATATRLKEERELRLKAEAEVKQLAVTVEHKEEVIEGLLDEIPVAEKRQRINQIVRGTKGCSYQERWGMLYKEFDKVYHIDTNRRLINAKNKGQVKQNLNRVGYICDVMNMTDQLYSIACKLFEGDTIKLMREMWSTLN